jgi:hypothetical protein
MPCLFIGLPVYMQLENGCVCVCVCAKVTGWKTQVRNSHVGNLQPAMQPLGKILSDNDIQADRGQTHAKAMTPDNSDESSTIQKC